MQFCSFLLTTLITMFLLVPDSLAQSVTVTYLNAGGVPIGSQTYAPNQSISIAIDNVIWGARVTTSSSTVDIGAITIEDSLSGGGQQPVWVYITPNAVPGSGFPTSASGRDLKGITDFRSAGPTFVKGRIRGNLTGHLIVKNLQSFYVEGQIQKTVTSDSGPFLLRAGSVTSQGDIRSNFGNIALVQIDPGGNLLGDIRAPQGDIQDILVQNGNAGQFGLPIAIEADGLINIFKANNTFANITAKVSSPLDIGFIGSFVTHGSFTGTISASRFNSTFFTIENDLHGTINFGSVFLGNRIMEIGHSFGASASINFNSPTALRGQIIINKNDSAGTWGGTVNVGSTALTAREYTQTAGSLGGGSVGLAPFSLHDESCSPVNGTGLFYHPDPTTPILPEVRLRHYGPITISGSNPVSVFRRPACTTGSFTNVTGNFNFAVDSADENTLLVTPKSVFLFDADFEYKITPNSSLVCQNVAGSPPVSWSGDYLVSVVETIPADCDPVNAADGSWGDGTVDIFDLTALLNNFGLCPTEDICYWDIVPPGSVNQTVNIDDLVEVLNSWGPVMGCSTAPASSSNELQVTEVDFSNGFMSADGTIDQASIALVSGAWLNHQKQIDVYRLWATVPTPSSTLTYFGGGVETGAGGTSEPLVLSPGKGAVQFFLPIAGAYDPVNLALLAVDGGTENPQYQTQAFGSFLAAGSASGPVPLTVGRVSELDQILTGTLNTNDAGWGMAGPVPGQGVVPDGNGGWRILIGQFAVPEGKKFTAALRLVGDGVETYATTNSAVLIPQ